MDFDGGDENHETIGSCLSSYCISDELTDVHFSFTGHTGQLQRISAHKMILAFRSPVFKAMFYGTFPQTEGDIQIIDITSDTFLAFKRYIYTDEVELNGKMIIPLLHAAQKYQISSLLFKCATYLSRILNVQNACTIFTQAKFFSLLKLEKEALQFIAKNAAKCFSTDDFLKISSKNLKDIIKLDSLCLSEIHIFQSVLKWADHKLLKTQRNVEGYSRRDELIQDGILYKIAMPLLALDDFTKTVVPSGILTDEEQLYVFKAITMKESSNSHRFQFRRNPRKGNEILTLNLDNVVFQYEDQLNRCERPKTKWHCGINQLAETLTIQSLKSLKIVSISFKRSIPEYGKFEEIKGPNNLPFIISIKDKTYKGTYENKTWNAEINYFIPPNEIVNIEVSFEDKGRGCFQNKVHVPPNYRQMQHISLCRKRHLNFTWTEKGQALLEFETNGTRLIENIYIVEVNNLQ